MQDRQQSKIPVLNFILFVSLSFAVLLGHALLMSYLNPQDAKAPQELAAGKADEQKVDEEQPKLPATVAPVENKQEKPDDSVAGDQVAAPDGAPAAEQAEPEGQWVMLGSADPAAPYRMLVTLTNRGAAVSRIELNSPRYLDLEDRSGYLGHLVVDEELADKQASGRGCYVQVVGQGTPAAEAGVEQGDLIVAVDNVKINTAGELWYEMQQTKPKQQLPLKVLRDGKELTLTATLRRRPLDVVKPDNNDPLSMLLSFRQIGDEELPDPHTKMKDDERKEDKDEELDLARPAYINAELPGVNLREGNWEIVEADQTHVTFRRVVPKFGLAVLKTYRLAKIPNEGQADPNYKAYHLVFEIEIENIGRESQKFAYQLDGPTGLPTEGWWYANKIGRSGFFGGAAGLRDVVVLKEGNQFSQIGCPVIAKDEFGAPGKDQRIDYIGVDAQYFSAVVIPEKDDPNELWFAEWEPIRVGRLDPELVKLTDTSCRLTSTLHTLEPGKSLKQRFEVFAGPKKPPLLAQYGLDQLVYYGWFGWLARPMVKLLHVFHDYFTFGNFGLAIILLTIVVRGAMYPLSHKQALGAQKMQLLQPELKKLQEKYKNDMEGRSKAQQELFRKHNYNPLSGCLVLFVQLPIFIALYRSLWVDVELRGAPLISQSIRWCSDLAAPDMLFYWGEWMPKWVSDGQGMFGLGPYFNLLPILTIFLFIAQQKMFMPPPTDEQQAMQQKVMKFMMVFMGFLFFKVASGLCIYFVASSLWGLAERRLLPKPKPVAGADAPQSRADAKTRARAEAVERAKAAEKRAPSNGEKTAGKSKRQKKNRPQR